MTKPFDITQITLDINDAEHISIVSIRGQVEIAIVGPEGVYHNTVTMLNNEKDLRNFMKQWFGE